MGEGSHGSRPKRDGRPLRAKVAVHDDDRLISPLVSLVFWMPSSEPTLRELRRINRKTTLLVWLVAAPVVLLGLFWLAMTLVGPSVELT